MSAQSLSPADTAVSTPESSESSNVASTSSAQKYPNTLSSGRSDPNGSPNRLETFEDLLRDAGYKDTRVVTPRAERLRKDAATYSSSTSHPDDAAEEQTDSGYKFYGATVPTGLANFLTSLVTPSRTMSLGRAASSKINKGLEDRSRTSTREQVATTPRHASVASRALHRQLHRKSSLKAVRSPVEYTATTRAYDISGTPLIHSPSSATTTSTVRPRGPKRQARIRHTVSSPHITRSTAASPTSSNGSRQATQLTRTTSGSSTHSRRPPLPESWFGTFTKMVMGPSRSTSASRPPQESVAEDRRPTTPNRRRNSSTTRRVRTSSVRQIRRPAPEKLLARSRSYATARPPTTTQVNIICRSSSVGTATRKRPPLLISSTRDDNPLWADTGNPIVSPIPRIQLSRTLRRTGSMSTGRTSLSRANTGASGAATPSPLATGNREALDLEFNFHHYGEGADTDDDELEPHLSNILAPHPGRQQSIQSLRACLHRHQSISNFQTASPTTSSFAANISGTTGSSIEEHNPTTPGSSSLSYSQALERGKGSLRRSRKERVFDEDDLKDCIRVIESNENDEESKRGRRSQRNNLLRLGVGEFQWTPSRSASNFRSPVQRAPLKSKASDKELERERLLWGTSWGRDHS